MDPVLIIGSMTVDIILRIHHLPKQKEDLAIHSSKMQLGGCAYNIANVFHCAHYPYRFISAIGNGLYGNFIKEQLKKQGYHHRLFVKEEHGCCYCLVDASGERTFLAQHGAEYCFRKEWMNPYKNEKFSYVYVCGLDIEEKGGQEIIEYLAELDTPILFAPGSRWMHIATEKMEKILKMHPILHLNEEEAMAMSESKNIEEALEKWYSRTQNTVIITRGEKGCVMKDHKEILYVKGRSRQVKDTIGAGDTHAAAFLLRRCQQASLKDALEYANEMAGRVVEREGSLISKRDFES